jgi:hypothetical protein
MTEGDMARPDGCRSPWGCNSKRLELQVLLPASLLFQVISMNIAGRVNFWIFRRADAKSLAVSN